MSDKNINRPLSPHLTIYKPQISSVLSIMHRISGAYLFAGILVFAWWIVIAVYCAAESDLSKWSFFVENIIGKIMIFGWSAALFYHMLNGVRHLYWDCGRGFDKKSVTISGVVVIIGAMLLTIISWYIALK